MSNDPYAPPRHDSPDDPRAAHGVTQVSPAQAEEIRARIKRLNSLSLALGAPGLLLQAVGNIGSSGLAVKVVGAALLVAGLSTYARMRGRSGWFGALGLLSCLGIIFLALLPKRCHHCGATTKGATCTACGAPAPK